MPLAVPVRELTIKPTVSYTMKHFLPAILLLAAPLAMAGDSAALVSSAPAPAQTTHLRAYRWLRRATLVGACISGTVLDTWALHRLASYPNVQLSGPFISNGKPNYGELIGLFGGSCALSTFMEEKHVFASRETRTLDLEYSFENAAAIGASVWAADRFLSLANQAAAAERVQPGTLAAMVVNR